MKKAITKGGGGFTIIEVALVIAVGGLIFMMVFVALPSLQRSQRDATRREDMMTYLEQLKKYQTNNRGALPTDWGKFMNDYFGGRSDPSGEAYTQDVIECGSDINADTPCAEQEEPTDDAIKIKSIYDSSFPYGNYTFLVIKQATCNGDTPIKTSNPRNVAILYKMEGAGVYCSNT